LINQLVDDFADEEEQKKRGKEEEVMFVEAGNVVEPAGFEDGRRPNGSVEGPS